MSTNIGGIMAVYWRNTETPPQSVTTGEACCPIWLAVFCSQGLGSFLCRYPLAITRANISS